MHKTYILLISLFCLILFITFYPTQKQEIIVHAQISKPSTPQTCIAGEMERRQEMGFYRGRTRGVQGAYKGLKLNDSLVI